MDLLVKLLALSEKPKPTEDFFSEVVAYFFKRNPDFLKIWLETATDSHFKGQTISRISTQRSYLPLESHEGKSRPDLVIELESEDGKSSIVFVESKISSREGKEQLKRYAEILGSIESYEYKYLIYITRDYEPKDKFLILCNVKTNKINFFQTRWFLLYQLLTQFPETYFREELAHFMEIHKMAVGNHFSPLDIVSLVNFEHSLNLVNACLDDEVKDRFNNVFGCSIQWPSSGFHQLRHHKRIVMFASTQQSPWKQVGCFMGFDQLNIDSASDYPVITIALQIQPDFSNRDAVISRMHEISRDSTNAWHGVSLNETDAWSSIRLSNDMKYFLPEKDHVASIKQFFLDGLAAVESLRERYPDLPWQSK